MRARAERVGARIQLQTEVRIRNLSADVPGAYWRAGIERWSMPLSMDICRNLREVFGDGLLIGPELNAWAKAEVSRERSLSELGRNLTGVELLEVPKRYPALAARMSSRLYQASAARFVAEGRSVLIADSVGLGKTTEALAGVVESGVAGPYLVVGPKTSLRSAWEREVSTWIPDAYVAPVRQARPARTRSLDEALNPAFDLSNTWVIINIEMIRTQCWWDCGVCGERFKSSDRPKSDIVLCGCDIRKVKTVYEHEYPQLFGVEFGAIIMDESQRSLIRTSGTPTLVRAGARLLQVRADGLRIAMSATPMRGKPQRLWGTLNWLRPDVYRGYWSWTQRYWKVVGGYGGSLNIQGFNTAAEPAFNAALDGIMLRRTKAEVSPELPRRQYMGTPLEPGNPDSPVAVWLDPDPKQDKAYQEMLRMGSAEVKGKMVNAIGVLAEMTRLKQFATSYGEVIQKDGLPHFRPALPSNKYDWVAQFLQESSLIDPDDEPGGKIIIVSQFTEVLALFRRSLEEKYGLRSRSITGSVTGSKRLEAEDTFNDPASGVNVMFLNTKAGGVSITLDAADDMIFLDETFDPDDQEQAEGRNDNRRPEEKVVPRRYWYLKTLGTVDEAIAKVNLSMDKELKGILDGRRGVTYVREVLKEMGIG